MVSTHARFHNGRSRRINRALAKAHSSWPRTSAHLTTATTRYEVKLQRARSPRVRASADLSQQRVRRRWQLNNRGQFAEEIDCGGNRAVDEGCEILKGDVFSDPLGSASRNTDAL